MAFSFILSLTFLVSGILGCLVDSFKPHQEELEMRKLNELIREMVDALDLNHLNEPTDSKTIRKAEAMINRMSKIHEGKLKSEIESLDHKYALQESKRQYMLAKQMVANEKWFQDMMSGDSSNANDTRIHSFVAKLKMNDEHIWHNLVHVDLKELKQEKDMKIRILLILGALEYLRSYSEENQSLIKTNSAALIALSSCLTITLLMVALSAYVIRILAKKMKLVQAILFVQQNTTLRLQQQVIDLDENTRAEGEEDDWDNLPDPPPSYETGGFRETAL